MNRSGLEASRLAFGGITDIEGARQIARRIFETYDRDRNGLLDSIEVAPMMVDAYRAMNKGFNPSKADVDTYSRILDRNNDGRVTLQDLEDLAIKYLVGEFKQERVDVVKRSKNRKNKKQKFILCSCFVYFKFLSSF